ncbi:threonine-phosphate decarboxylase [Haloarcula taiwanensis]|uniref:Aminotransferase n=1 Tax=Haloarcula taiwanensis TaxID=1932004 RepID=A0A2H5A0I2_9EURY|nr:MULTISPECIES: threonine-phosphate decarboxylase [Haloarcula]AUG48190.1 threonine-phosphate decarboxylase [Haloarcula taiwanensis]RLM39546.1 pyridoxal phosphate-dependent class II aminotransferase [Haloarcula sp. Atlit-120R]RLM47511.1 pyridoxal phosphate-dependent class II aminotransferase [Haloarcula sp. Atlit-47R]
MDPDSVEGVRTSGGDGPEDAIGPDGRVPHGSSDDPDVLDFSANTNPQVPPGAEKAYLAAFETARSYPADGYPEFREAAAAFVGCEPSQVIPTAGGLEAIRLSIQTTIQTDDSVLLPYPSFGEYAREVRLQGGTPEFIPHDQLLAADPAGHALVVVCNPNNPTGETAEPGALRDFADRCRAAGTTLLVDEAFLGFTGEPSLAGREGVIVARSLTKLFGLPGIRMGYAVGTGQERDRLATARRAWSMSAAAAAVGAHCYGQTGFVTETKARVAEERARMRERLVTRFDVFRSDAPFLLLSVSDADTSVDGILASAREAGIALRDARTFRGLDSHIRVAVRAPEENDRLLDALDV